MILLRDDFCIGHVIGPSLTNTSGQRPLTRQKQNS